MSISINGFRLNVSSLDDAFARLHALRPTTHKMIADSTARFVAITAQTYFDMKLLHPKNEAHQADGVHPLSAANKDMKRRQKESDQTGWRDTDVDFGFEIVLIPSEGMILGSLFAEQPAYRRWFLDLPFVESFEYYDGTDSYLDKGFTHEQWKERERIWNVALNDFDSTFSEAGISMRMAPSLVLTPTDDDIMRMVETPEARAAKYAKDQLMNERILAGASNKTDEIMREFFAAEKWLATAEGQQALVVRTAEIQALLPVLTIEMMLGFSRSG